MKTKHWLIEGMNEWSQLRGGYNWYTMTLIHIYFEKDSLTHGYEFEFTLLGLGFRIRYNTDKALKQFEKWSEEVDETINVWSSEELKENLKDTNHATTRNKR